MKKLKKIVREKIKYQTSPEWKKVFGFMDSIMENLPDVIMYIVGYISISDGNNEDTKFKIFVHSDFEVNEDFVIDQFTGYDDSVLKDDSFLNSTFEISEIISPDSQVENRTKDDIRGIYGIPVYSDKKFLGRAIFYSTKEPEDIFEDKKSTALMSALAQSACYSISYREQSEAREIGNKKLLKANDELLKINEELSKLITITKNFRTIKSKGELFRVATAELSKLIPNREIKLKIFSKIRNNLYTECMAINGEINKVEDLEIIELVNLKKCSTEILENEKFGKQDIGRIYTLVKKTRQHFINSNSSKTLPAGIFPFRMGEEVDGVLTISYNKKLGKFGESETTLINLFSQFLGYSFLLLENLYMAKEETNDIDNVINFLMTIFKETIEAASSGFELIPTLNYIADTSKTLNFSLENNLSLNEKRVNSGNFELVEDNYIFSNNSKIEEKFPIIEKKIFNQFLEEFGKKIEEKKVFEKAKIKYKFLKSFAAPIVFIPYNNIDNITGFFFVSKKSQKLDSLKRNDYIFTTIQEQVKTVIESYRLQKSAEKKKIIDQQLKMARNIQQSFLPSEIPEKSTILFSAFSDPSKEVGGDFYDIVQYRDGSTGFIIADVSGKGPAAALITVMLRTLVKYNGPKFEKINELITFLNNSMADELDVYSFVTMTYLKISEDGKVEIINCGHNPTTIYRKERETFEEIGSIYPPIGILKNTTYEITNLVLNRDDRIMLYTDGITEAANKENEFFGEERLRKSFKNSVNEELSKQLSSIKNDYEVYIGEVEPSDDVTVVLISLNEENGSGLK